MTKPTDNPNPSRTLRERAEEMLTASHTDIAGMSADEIQRLVHELQVHQMELEIQNEDLRGAQIELAHSRDRYSDLYEFAPVGYLSLDRHGVIEEANLTAAVMLGVERKRLTSRKLTDFLPDEAQETWHLHRRKVFSEQTKETCELAVNAPDGNSLTVRLESLAFADEDGNWSHCRTALIDVSNLRHARQQLQESEQRYRRLTEAVTDYIYHVRIEHGRAAETTHGANCEAVTGYTPEEFQANPLLWIAMVPPEDRAVVERQAADILSNKDAPPIEHRIQCKVGAIRWVLNTTSPQHDDQGRLIAYDGLLRDISERKRAEDALQQLNEELEQRVDIRTAELRARTDQLAAHSRELEQRDQEVRLQAEAIDNLGEGVLITSDHLEWPGPHIVFVNEAMCRITGYTANELIGQSPRMLQGNGSDRETLDRIKTELSAGHSCQAELVNYRKDGTPYDADLFITPMFDSDGRHTHFVSIHRDITERKRIENETRQLSKVFLDAAEAIFIKDLAGNIIDLNAAAERQYGWTRGELIGRSIKILVPKDEHAQRDELMAHCLRGEEVRGVEVSRVTKSGEVLPVLLTYSLLTDDAGQPVGIATISEDIRERKRAEEALRDSEERLRAILNTAADAIINIDQRGIITAANPATEQMFGYTQNELVGQNVKILMPAPYHDEHDGYIARYLETGEARIIGIGREVIGRHKDGSTFPIGVAVSEVEHLDLFTGVIRDVSERHKLQRDVLGIAEDEQRRIGQDLHDSTQQELAGLGMLAQTLLDNLSKQASSRSRQTLAMSDRCDSPNSGEFGYDVRELATKIVDGIARTHREVQTISRGLVPIRLEPQGLMDGLREIASRTDDLQGVTCAFKCEQSVEIADSLTATHLYRIAQEAITNALKHGRPEHILIALESDDGHPVLQVADDGPGFDSTEKSEGMGLKTMRYRAGLIDARLTLSRVETGGTLVRCQVYGGGNLR